MKNGFQFAAVLFWTPLIFGDFGYFVSPAFGYESQFQVNSKLDLVQLEKKKEISIQTWVDGDVYRSDASAIYDNVDFNALYGASIDFNRYVKLKMPNLLESLIVDHSADGQYLYTWNHVSYFGQSSRQFLEVHLRPRKGSNWAGTEWQSVPGRQSWVASGHRESSAFTRFEGSWYIRSLGGNKVYVRYYLVGSLQTFVPQFLIQGLIEGQFRDGVKQVIEILVRNARLN